MNNENDIKLKKLEIKINLYRDLFKAILFVLTADVGGTLTIMLNFEKYNPNLTIALIGLGMFIAFGLLYVLGIILFEIKKLNSKLES